MLIDRLYTLGFQREGLVIKPTSRKWLGGKSLDLCRPKALAISSISGRCDQDVHLIPLKAPPGCISFFLNKSLTGCFEMLMLTYQSRGHVADGLAKSRLHTS